MEIEGKELPFVEPEILPYQVIIDRPYYPWVQPFATLEEAQKVYNETIAGDDVFVPDGHNEAAVYLVKVMHETHGKSYY